MTIERLITSLRRLIEIGTASAELRKSVTPPRRNEMENEVTLHPAKAGGFV